MADNAALSASERDDIALRLKVLNAIVLRLTAILGVQFNGLLNVQSEPANRFYLLLRQLAEPLALPFPELSAALTTFTASYPNLYESGDEVDWESVTRLIGPFKARASEELLRIGADVALPLPQVWTELFATADAAIIELQQERQDRDAEFEARVAAVTAGATMASTFASARERLRTDEPQFPPRMQTPTRWAAISGRWRLPIEDGGGDRSLDYLGPSPDQTLPYGLAICDLSLAEGDFNGQITFDHLEDTAAGLVIGFFAAHAPYVIAELGAHGSAYAISYYMPLANRWSSRPMTGSKANLRTLTPYAVSVRLDGLRISMSVDGIEIFDQMLEQPLMGARVGVYAWGERSVVHFDCVAALERRAAAGFRASAPIEPDTRPKAIVLTRTEERELAGAGALVRVNIHITGRVERGSQNVVEVDGRLIRLTLAPFRLFLRLVLGLYETGDGYVDRGSMRARGGLVDEGYYQPQSLEQALARLRAPFSTALDPVPVTDLIEVSRGRVRISTHRRFVSWDARMLSRHSDHRVVQLLERLERAKQS